MKQLYVDCTNGISSDMILGALKAVGADEDYIGRQIDILGLEKTQEQPESERKHSHNSSQSDHEHEKKTECAHHFHRSHREIRELIQNSGLSSRVKATTLSIYRVIAKGEAKVHNTTVEDVHFHEVGRPQAISNIVGVAAALESLRINNIYCSEIHDGKGSIQCSHGIIPVPVPAVMAIREQCDYRFVIEEGVKTEMVTPSGLGILVGIGAKMAERIPKGEILKEAEVKGARNTGKGGLKVFLLKGERNAPKRPTPIKNDELLESIRKTKKEPSKENTVKMLNQVVRAKLIAPVSLDRAPVQSGPDGQVELEKDTKISFEMIATKTGEIFYPVFTHGAEMKKCEVEKNQHSLLVNFEDLANMVLNQAEVVKGFVINPMGENVCFRTDTIKSMIEEIRSARKQTDEE